MRITLMIMFMALVFWQCSKDESLSPADQLKKDIEIIETYLTDNNLTAQSTPSGLHYIIQNPGTGANPSANNVVTVYYQGYFTNKKVFDQTVFGSPVTFPLKQVIKGWQEGIPLLKRGGVATLLIPSALGYGNNPPSGIPSNAVLIFDVELLDF